MPGFNMLRAPGRFLPIVALFLVMLSGLGLDDLIAARKRPTVLMIGASGLALACGVIGGVILISASRSPSNGWWAHFVHYTFNLTVATR